MSWPLRQYLLNGTPMQPEALIHLGHEHEVLAQRLDFAHRDLSVADLPNAHEVEIRIAKMKRFAARASILLESGPRPQQYIMPPKPKRIRKQSRQQG